MSKGFDWGKQAQAMGAFYDNLQLQQQDYSTTSQFFDTKPFAEEDVEMTEDKI